jgi:hypothetical protein
MFFGFFRPRAARHLVVPPMCANHGQPASPCASAPPPPPARPPLRRPRARTPCPPRRPRLTFYRHRSWSTSLQDPLFLWELQERAPMTAPIRTRYLAHHRLHEQRPACRRESSLHQRRQRRATLPLGRPSRRNGPCKKTKCKSCKLTAVSMSSSIKQCALAH